LTEEKHQLRQLKPNPFLGGIERAGAALSKSDPEAKFGRYLVSVGKSVKGLVIAIACQSVTILIL